MDSMLTFILATEARAELFETRIADRRYYGWCISKKSKNFSLVLLRVMTARCDDLFALIRFIIIYFVNVVVS